MKKAKILNRTEKSYFLQCPKCKNQMRRSVDRKTEKLNYKTSIICPKCGERSLFCGSNIGKKIIRGKILCPICKKNKMCKASNTCMECYCKNPFGSIKKYHRSYYD